MIAASERSESAASEHRGAGSSNARLDSDVDHNFGNNIGSAARKASMSL